MKRSTQILNNIFSNIPTTVVFCWFMQQLAVWRHTAVNFSLKEYFINFPVGYLTGLICGFCLPGVVWGIKFAVMCGTKSESTWNRILVNFIANTVNSTVLLIVMTIFNVCILHHRPIAAVIPEMIENYIPVWCVGYLVSYISVPFCQKLARICTETA